MNAMAAKWQQWMPLKIDAFKSSPAVRAMHPAARSGYLYLLLYAWQTEDCTVPNDQVRLAEISEIGDKLWAHYGPRILRKFDAVEGGLRNLVQYEEWLGAKRIFESRRKSAKNTNDHRWANGDPSVTDEGPNRSAYTRTGTGTVKLNTPPYPPQAGEEGKPRRLTRAQRRAAVGSNILWESAPALPDAPVNFADAPPGWCEEAQRHYAEGRMLTNLQRRYILSLEVVNA